MNSFAFLHLIENMMRAKMKKQKKHFAIVYYKLYLRCGAN